MKTVEKWHTKWGWALTNLSRRQIQEVQADAFDDGIKTAALLLESETYHTLAAKIRALKSKPPEPEHKPCPACGGGDADTFTEDKLWYVSCRNPCWAWWLHNYQRSRGRRSVEALFWRIYAANQQTGKVQIPLIFMGHPRIKHD